jgi:hypothetical protein
MATRTSTSTKDKPASARSRGRKKAASALSRRGGAPPPPRLTDEVIAYLDALYAGNPAQVICLGYGHLWAVLVPGRGKPAGWRSFRIPGGGGVFGIEEDCIRDELGDGTTCESVRVSHTGMRGIFLDRGVNRQYKRGEHWKVRPENSRITRLDVIDYLTWTMGDELFADGGPEQGEGAIA